MKALIKKDYRLLLSQKSLYGLIAVAAVMLYMMEVGTSFVIGYLTFIFAMTTVGALSFDQSENGMRYLMALPISKKIYYNEKYAFALINILGGFLLSCILVISSALAKPGVITRQNGEAVLASGERIGTYLKAEIIASLPLVGAILLIMAVTIFVQLKFGTEKGRLMMVFLTLILCVIVYFTAKKQAETDLESAINAMLKGIPEYICILSAMAGVVSLLVSRIAVGEK